MPSNDSDRRLLVIEDDPSIAALVAALLEAEGVRTAHAPTAAAAREMLREDASIAAALLDLGLPDADGRDLLSEFRRDRPRLPTVMFTARDDAASVVECMRLGAADFVSKPFEAERLLASVRGALERGELRREVDVLAQELRRGERAFGRLIGRSVALRRATALLARAARSDVAVLLLGESGTGKEVAARALHAESARAGRPFVPINCGAIPEALIESELFGHERGAFTGAVAARKGAFEEAAGGTIFLDEIGELRPDLQVRLLRVLQERTIRRVGGAEERAVDFRVIAATHRDLDGAAGRGSFREDLYYRLAVFPVRLPPLRDREGDVLLLADAVLAAASARHGRRFSGFSPAAAAALEAWPWPGNVRELENAVERAALLEDGDQIELASLPPAIVEAALRRTDRREPAAAPCRAADGLPEAPSAETVDDILPFDAEERRIVERALRLTGGDVAEAARRLVLGRATLYRKIEAYGLRRG